MKRLLLIGALCAFAGSARAGGTYDPDIEQLTITTPHFQVVFAQGYGPIGARTASIAEALFPYMSQRYGWEPDGRTTIIINDQTDFANGSATIVPNKVVTLYVTQPTETSGLEDYDDWLFAVLVHELAHIFHLDMAYGLPWIGRFPLGKYASMNLYTPAWIVEGFAVYEETVSSGAGRGRSSYVDMALRTAALEDRFPGIDQGYRGFADWPFGNLAYFFGGRFQVWLASKFGEEALLHYHRAYASDPIPYFTYLPAEIAFDQSLESLWNEWEAEVTREARSFADKVRTSTTYQPSVTRLTNYGGDLSGPRYSPDGKWILFSTDSPKDGSRMRRLPVKGGEDEVLVDDTFSKAVAFSPDGRALYFQQTEINQRYYLHNSLLRFDLDDGGAARLEIEKKSHDDFVAPSGSLRARDPDVASDGFSIVFVQAPYGGNRLILANLGGKGGATLRSPKVIVPAAPDVQLSSPRFSPDGTLIALSRFQGGRRDILLYERSGKQVEEITRDRALDVDPTWSPDGKWLLFASDRDGASNLYAHPMDGGPVRQLTKLVTGAFQPSVSPDGKSLVFRGYSADGFDVYQMAFEPEKAPIVSLPLADPVARDATPRRLPAPNKGIPALPPPVAQAAGEVPALDPTWTLDDYTSADTLLPFHDNWNLFPTAAVNERELFGRLTTIGRDALDTQAYSLWVDYRTATRFVGGGGSYINDQLEPTFALVAYTDLTSFPLFDEAQKFLEYYDQQRLVAGLSIGVPLLQRHLISIGYTFEHRRLSNILSDDTIERTRFGVPAGGNFARLTLGYRYSNVRNFEHSVSLERGFQLALALQGLSKGLGSDYEQIVASVDFRHYLTLPWLNNHVLATRIFARGGFGRDLADDGFIGGVFGESILTTTTRDIFPLRGMVTAGLAGNIVMAGTFEYRAPIWRIERGLWTLPIAFRVVHAAVFTDFGQAFESLTIAGDPNFVDFFRGFGASVGAELRADILVGYSIPLDLRVGYAQLLHSPEDGLDASGPYFQIGTTY